MVWFVHYLKCGEILVVEVISSYYGILSIK